MRLAFFRLKGLKKFIVIINVLLIMVYTYGPNLQADAYKKTAAIVYDEKTQNDYYNVGYPAAKGYREVSSVEEIIELEYFDTFTITTDVSNLQPTHVYGYILGPGGKFKNSIWKWLVNNVENGGIGQYYVLTMNSQEKIIIYLDDTAIDLPKSGMVTLPIGAYLQGGSEEKYFSEIHEKYGICEEAKFFYIDTVGLWRKSAESIEAEELRTDRCFYFSVCLIGIEVLLYIIMRKIGKKEQEVHSKGNTK